MNIPNYQITKELYESYNSIIYQAIREKDNKSVILKILKEDYPTSEKLAHYQQEYNITKCLSKVDGVINIYHIDRYKNILIICLEDFGGKSLEYCLSEYEFTIDKLLKFSISITNTLGEIHQHNIIHKDINISNLILNTDTCDLKIIDFGISSQLPKQYLTLKNFDVLEGTLNYISPEQTGRMNRVLDYRTDFYSLGVTLYKMFTGRLPFESEEPMELIHCHIAKQPIPPHQINPKLPQAISNIILKLIEKTAEARYQSTFGIINDLEKCRDSLQKTGSIESFTLAQQDILDKLQIPQKLYGRETEINTLLNALDNVTYGQSEMMFITGYSGIGKSVLVKEIYKCISKKDGYFISGKFDQFQRNTPYTAIANAFTELMQQLLTESEDKLKQWKGKLLKALGNNGQVIIDVIPKIELIIGVQPVIPILKSTDSQNRFNIVFKSFLKVFTKNPLVIFLDDLQWVDSATLQLLEIIMTDETNQTLFLIGAYRDNEVSQSHPLMMTIDTLRNEQVKIKKILLKPLKYEHVNQLISDSLHQDYKTIGSLSDLVIRKTNGNPFFITQFLHNLVDENLLKFIYISKINKKSWDWDINQIESMSITDNVVYLMLHKLRKLPKKSQEIIQLSSCVGNTFDINTLAMISKQSVADTFKNILPILQEGFILPITELELDNSYLRYSKFRFLHDRVQQAAYALIDNKLKQTVHLQIGRLLLANVASLEEHIFEITDQLNEGACLIEDKNEKLELAKLNLQAGKKAKESIAYLASSQYLNFAIKFLPEKCWKEYYELSFDIYIECAESEFLATNFKVSEELCKTLIKYSKLNSNKIKIYHLQILLNGAKADYINAIEIGFKGLQLLGIKIPQLNEVTNQLFLTEMKEFKRLLGDRQIDELFDLPDMEDKNSKEALALISNIADLASIAHPDAFKVLTITGIIISLKHGNSLYSALYYVMLGVIFVTQFREHITGHQIASLGIRLNEEKYQFPGLISKQAAFFDWHVNHWVKNPLSNIEFGKKGFIDGMQCNNIAYATYCYSIPVLPLFFTGSGLNEVVLEVDKVIEFCDSKKMPFISALACTTKMLAMSLQGNTESNLNFSHQDIDEKEFINTWKEVQMVAGNYYIRKLQNFYLFGEYKKALEFVPMVEKSISGCGGHLSTSEYHFYRALAVFALPSAQQKQYIEIFIISYNFIKLCSKQCEDNFLVFHTLLKAESARQDGNRLMAMDLYDQAIVKAKEVKVIQNEALANELAAYFYFSQDKNKVAMGYIIEAHYLYDNWGASAKANELEKKYSQFLAYKKISQPLQTNATISVTRMASTTSSQSSSWLDLNSVMKASQALSEEIVLNKLLTKMIQIVIENAGAEKGFLLLPTQGSWFIEAEGQIDSKEEVITVLQSLPLEKSEQIPISIINYVIRTKENIVLEDAIQDGSFTNNSYIIKHKPKSILCIPLLNQAKLAGILYLENNLATGVFTSERIEILNLLSSQIAISIENSLLYNTLEQKVEDRTHKLQLAKEIAEDANKAIMDSIEYAKLIQLSLLPNLEQVTTYFPDSFFTWNPRDIVGGDMLYFEKIAEGFIIAVIDCTGHGVPGAFMTMITITNLRRIVKDEAISEPSKILQRLNFLVKTSLQQDTEYAKSDDGLDAALCFIKPTENMLTFAGAKLPLYYIHNEQIKVIKGDKQSLGYKRSKVDFSFTTHTIDIKTGMAFYLSTDGFLDQLGGKKRFQFGRKRFKNLLLKNYKLPFEQQSKILQQNFREYQADNNRQDDVTIIGFK